jgi:hypothetical protein
VSFEPCNLPFPPPIIGDLISWFRVHPLLDSLLGAHQAEPGAALAGGCWQGWLPM